MIERIKRTGDVFFQDVGARELFWKRRDGQADAVDRGKWSVVGATHKWKITNPTRQFFSFYSFNSYSSVSLSLSTVRLRNDRTLAQRYRLHRHLFLFGLVSSWLTRYFEWWMETFVGGADDLLTRKKIPNFCYDFACGRWCSKDHKESFISGLSVTFLFKKGKK